MSWTEPWTRDQLLAADLGPTVVWASPSVRQRVREGLPFPLAEPLTALPAPTRQLVVVGGGTLLDASKLWITEHAPAVTLTAIPSLWGSGAEVSPVAVRTVDGTKQITVDPALVPDRWVIWPELVELLPESLARAGCGDTWCHALEGFLSPLAQPSLRSALAELIGALVRLPLARDARWFALSARACAGQAQSSVGLIHGIAHTLELPLVAAQPERNWGHAALCSLFLWPVLRFNRDHSDKWRELTAQYGLDEAAILAVARRLFDEAAYRLTLPLLEQHWRQVLRDRCTRTNSVLVRPGHLAFFTTLGGDADA